MTLTLIEDITPYDVYSSLTVRDSVPAEHVSMISELLLETLYYLLYILLTDIFQ